MRRANATQINTKRLGAEPGAEGDWVAIKTSIPYGEFTRFQGQNAGAGKDAETADELNHRLLHMFIADWSFVDEAGQTLPVTLENVKDNADEPILTDAFFEVVSSDFLDKMSRLKKASS